MKTKRRPPIEGNFRVLVVPEGDVTLGSTLTIPGTVRATSGDLIRVVAQFRPADGVGLNAWAFTKRTRAKTVAGLRELADYIEQHDIPTTRSSIGSPNITELRWLPAPSAR